MHSRQTVFGRCSFYGFLLLTSLLSWTAAVGADVKAEVVTEKGQQQLQGSWRVILTQVGGPSGLVRSNALRGIRFAFSAETCVIFADDKLALIIDDLAVVTPMSVTIDSGITPHSIDLSWEIEKNKVVRHGIFKVQGDDLVICLSSPRESSRPKEFATSPDDGGSRLVKLCRSKPELDLELFKYIRDVMSRGEALEGRAQYEDCLALYESALAHARSRLAHRPDVQESIDTIVKGFHSVPTRRKDMHARRSAVHDLSDELNPIREKIRTRKDHDGRCLCMAFSPDGNLVVSGGVDERINIRDGTTGVISAKRACPKGCYSIVFMPSGRFVTGGGDGVIRVWDPRTERAADEWDAHSDRVSALAVSSDGRLLASGAYDGTIAIWDLATKKRLKQMKVPNGRITALLFGVDRLFSGGTTRIDVGPLSSGFADVVRKWNWEEKVIDRTLPCRGSILLHSGRTLIASGHWPQVTKTQKGLSYDGYHGTALDADGASPFLIERHGRGLAVSAGLLAFGRGSDHDLEGMGIIGPNGDNWDRSESRTVLWEIRARQRVLQLPIRNGTAMAFAPRGDRLAVGDWDGRTYLVNLLELNPSRGPLSSEDGRKLWQALGSGESAVGYGAVWKLAAHGESGVNIITEQFKASPVRDAKAIREFIRGLDDEKPIARDKAFEQLLKSGPYFEPLIRTELVGTTSLEVRRRLQLVLAQCASSPPPEELLRQVRAVAALELSNCAAARSVLKELAKGQQTVSYEAAEAVRREVKR